MALLRQLVTRRTRLFHPAFLYSSSRNASDKILADYIPGPYPKTERERLEASKKYGLLPHEYKPFPDDGFGKGDYPDLPMVGDESKDPWYPWDYPKARKNYGEVWHMDSDILTEDRWDPAKDWRLSPSVMVGMFLGVVGGSFLLAYLLEPYPLHRPVCAKQYPNRGKKHYSFERGN